MGVLCPVCGKNSRDPEFCDHCNADLATSPPPPGAPDLCPVAVPGIALSPEQWQLLSDPDASLTLRVVNHFWRVHWIPGERLGNWQDRLENRQSLELAALPKIRLAPSARGLWILAESAGADFAPWSGAGWLDPIENLAAMTQLTHELAELLEELHRHDLVWANFDPAALERGFTGKLQITNQDLHAFGSGQLPDDIVCNPQFMAPEIGMGHRAGPRSDVFHLAAFCYYWQAGLLPAGFAGQGLERFGHEFPPVRTYHPQVPERVWRLLSQGLAVNPSARPDSPRAFAAELAHVLELARTRREGAGPVAWEVGMHTRTGRCKSAQGKRNEDQVFSRNFAEPPRLLAAVADGISQCVVGQGELASLITTIVLENEFPESADASQFETIMKQLARKGAHKLLNWALEKGYQAQLLQGADLMGTTLTTCWIEDRWLHLANLGDSRAYLLTGDHIEQLTVDGDFATSLLRQGEAPEFVQDVGHVGKALVQCVGGCRRNSSGKLEILEDACQPTFSTWPLLPDDLVILCSDGLVEEGVFLHPDEVLELRRRFPAATPQAFADILAESADALQHLPNPLEPDGFGDNVSGIVIQITARRADSSA